MASRPFLAVLLVLAVALPSAADPGTAAPPDAVLELARRSGPGRAVLAAFPEVELEAELDADREKWVVRFHTDELREVAVVETDLAGAHLLDGGLSPEVESRLYGTRASLPVHGAVALAVLLALYGPWRGRWGAAPWDLALLMCLVIPLDQPLVDNRVAHTAIWLATLALMARALWAARRASPPEGPAPALGVPALAVLLACALAYHAHVLVVSATEDSGVWGAFGAQYLLRTGEWPYGQPHFGEGSAYGPLFYVLFAPATALCPPAYESATGWTLLDEALPETFERLSLAACKLTVAPADLAIVGLLVLYGRRARDWRTGLALGLVYAVLPYTALELIHPSRSVPTAFCVAALVLARRPAWAGAMLGAGVAVLHYPLALVPLWFSQYRGRERWTFVQPLVLIAALSLAAIHRGESDWPRFVESTWGYQEGIDRYGKSEFGFWGQNPSIALAKPVLRALHLVGCAALVFWRAGPSPHRLASMSAAILTGVQLWKTHGGGGYICWHLPFVLAALLVRAPTEATATSAARP